MGGVEVRQFKFGRNLLILLTEECGDFFQTNYLCLTFGQTFGGGGGGGAG